MCECEWVETGTVRSYFYVGTTLFQRGCDAILIFVAVSVTVDLCEVREPLLVELDGGVIWHPSLQPPPPPLFVVGCKMGLVISVPHKIAQDGTLWLPLLTVLGTRAVVVTQPKYPQEKPQRAAFRIDLMVP